MSLPPHSYQLFWACCSMSEEWLISVFPYNFSSRFLWENVNWIFLHLCNSAVDFWTLRLFSEQNWIHHITLTNFMAFLKLQTWLCFFSDVFLFLPSCSPLCYSLQVHCICAVEATSTALVPATSFCY